MVLRLKNHFAETCPCADCRAWRARRGVCRSHRVDGCLECSKHLSRPIIEILWKARYYLRGVTTRFLLSTDHVKKFAAVCPCELCSRWRARFVELNERGGGRSTCFS